MASRLFIYFLFTVSLSVAQQYPFLPVPGSPKGVTALFQDSRGRLWMGGAELTCFDGTRFFHLRDYGFPQATVFSIAEDNDGGIWIGAETGVYRFVNGRFEETGKGVGVSLIPITSQLAFAAVGSPGKGLPGSTALIRMQLTASGWTTETVTPLQSPGPLARDSSDTILFPETAKGWAELRLSDLLRWRPGNEIPITRHPLLNFAANGPMKAMRDHTGCVWFGASGGVGYDCGEGFHTAPFDGANMQAYMHEAPDGNMLLWSGSSLVIGRPGSFRIATPANGLAGPVDTLGARDGTVWLANAQGLYRFASPFRIEYWTAREGLPDAPWSIARSTGRMYAGLDRRIVALTPDRLRWETIATFKEGGDVTSLAGSPAGPLSATLMYGGVLQLAPDGKITARTGKDYHNNNSMRMTKTPDGTLWIGGGLIGQLKRNGNLLQFQNHPLRTQPSGNLLSVKYEVHTRKLWACYNGGLIVRDEHGIWKEFSTADGLLVNGCWSLAPLPNGDIWDAYYNLNALALIRPGADGRLTVRQYHASDGVPEPGNDTMDADRRGRLWRSGNVGIYVAGPAQAEAGQWLQLDQSDGLPSNDMNSGSVFVDDDGSLWWGADNDLAHYIPPDDLVAPQFSPQILVSAFSWDSGPPKLAEAVDGLPHGSNVVAHIGSLQFERRNALRLRYRIMPDQTAWRDTRNLDLALGSLSTGTHTLEVQGRVFTGPWSGTAGRSFTVRRARGLEWPFLTAYLMAATGLAAAGLLLHRRRQADTAELLPDLAAWRMRALLPEVHELAGTLLDSRFQVGDLLARGGFANVFSGYDCEQHQRCAIKIFRGEIKDKAWIQRSFEREVAALQKIAHPHVVSIYAHGTAQAAAPYLVMEFVEGRNLREVLEQGPLPPRRTARLLLQLASALDAIHAQGICHRDVKPENVILRNEGSPTEESVLIDFSIAIVKDANETLHGLSRAAGSFDYMAPEQAVGYAEPSSDIYSLAKLLIELLTGRQLKDLLPDAALDLPERVRSLPLHLSKSSMDVLAAALEFDPAKRPRAAGGFAEPIVNDLLS